MRRLLRALVLGGAVLGLAVPADAQRIDPNAAELLRFRLTPDAVAKLRQVMGAMDSYKLPSPDAVRSDLAVVSTLGASIPRGQPFNDAKVRETVTIVDRAHAKLRDTIKDAGMTSRDYVMAWITVLVAHPAIDAKKSGRPLETNVAPENLAFVEQEWPSIDSLMKDLGQRIITARGKN